MSRSKKILLTIAVLLSVICAYFVYTLYLRPDAFLRQIYLVPKDAIYIVETDDPVNSWHQFSKSAPWQLLKQDKRMNEIAGMANMLDSILNDNKTLMSMLGKRNLMISAHMTRKSDYDFLFVVDLQKASKIDGVKSQIENVFEGMDYRVTQRTYKGEKIIELFDPVEKSTIYLSFIDNHMVCSFTALLVEKSIQEKEDPAIGRDLYFLDIEPKTYGSGLCRIFLNYKYLPNYLSVYTGTVDEGTVDLCNAMAFTGLSVTVSDDKMALKGYTNVADTSNSYVLALLKSGNNKITAQKVLSNRTAFFMGMNFSRAEKFIDNLEEVLKQDDEAYKPFKKNWDLIESFLKIDIRKNFLSWMDGEVVFAQHTPGKLGRQNEFVAAIKITSKQDAKKNLDFVEERIRKRTPVKFKTIEYEEYEIHYMEIKGFFRLLFGKMFDRLDKPYYVIIDDYAVFSNSTATLLSMIEDYRTGQTLDKDDSFKTFLGNFNNQSTIFTYTNTAKFFPLWKDLLSPTTWKEMQGDKNIILSFPQTAFQLTSENNMFDTRWVASFSAYDNSLESSPKFDDTAEALDFAASEDTLSGIERFYIEKLMGNVYTELHPDGGVKSESEMVNGVKNGKYKSYYLNGHLQSYGKFSNNRKHGTWRYYNEDEKFERKEKWKNGELLDKTN